MTLYNPFKPHIVTNGTLYAVRKLTITGWLAKDIAPQPTEHWWLFNTVNGTSYKFGTLEQAEKGLNKWKYVKL